MISGDLLNAIVHYGIYGVEELVRYMAISKGLTLAEVHQYRAQVSDKIGSGSVRLPRTCLREIARAEAYGSLEQSGTSSHQMIGSPSPGDVPGQNETFYRILYTSSKSAIPYMDQEKHKKPP